MLWSWKFPMSWGHAQHGQQEKGNSVPLPCSGKIHLEFCIHLWSPTAEGPGAAGAEEAMEML